MEKKALITGITGQDGSYLAELLLGKGYQVYGIIRRASTFNTGRLDPIYSDPHLSRTRLFWNTAIFPMRARWPASWPKFNPMKSITLPHKATCV